MTIEEKILKQINSDPSIKRYKLLEEIINNDDSIKSQMNDLKELQKEIVHAKEFDKKILLTKLEKEYDLKYENIIKHPLMAEYIDLQHIINEMLQNFIEVVEMGINSDLTTKM